VELYLSSPYMLSRRGKGQLYPSSKKITGRENGMLLPEAGKQIITQPYISTGRFTHTMPFLQG
jgi:hypothetical protein